MFGINLKHSLATVAVATGLLAAAGPASAGPPPLYNGHAGLGASAYQHNQTDLAFLDGTSNTIMFSVRAASEPAVIEPMGTKY